MGPSAPATDVPLNDTRPRWSMVLRALREARGVTLDGWGARLGVSRTTVQRWERGERAPDPGAEASILAFCREAGLFRTYDRGPLAGLDLNAELLQDLFAEARWGGSAGPVAAPPSSDRSPAPRQESTPHHASLPPPSNLPLQLTSFVGREREIAAVRRVQAGTRLLTLTGAGGCGKTRLALRIADELLWAYPHGVWFVELASLVNPTLVPQVVASALAIQPTGPRPVTEALIESLRPRHLLLLLDNCEHLLPACAELVASLLRACPHLAVVATSRSSLGIAGETVYRVPPLLVEAPRESGVGSRESLEPAASDSRRISDAAALFVDRALLQRPERVLTPGDAATIAEICRRLDGMPLAIELAAARVSALSLDQIAERLSDRFRLLNGGSHTALPRHQTLRATMDWSYDLLAEPEQALLRALSVFAGGFTLEAAEAVCGAMGNRQSAAGTIEPRRPIADCPLPTAPDVLDLLASLVDKSLVIAEERDGAVRYRMLEMVRQYAGEKLDEAKETAPTRDHHLAWYVALAQRARAAVHGPEEPASLDRLEAEHDNLRTALAWSLSRETDEAALQLASDLHRFWEQRGRISEGRQWLTQALEVGTGTPAGVRATALHSAGWLAYKQGDLAVSRALIDRGLSLHQQTGNRLGIAMAHDSLGCIALRVGEHVAARTHLEASLALHTELGHQPGIASVLDALGMLAVRKGERDVARSHFEASLALNRGLGDKVGIAEALADLATVAGDENGDGQRTALLEESLALYREIGDRQGIALVLGNLGMTAWTRGEHGHALMLLEESLALYRDVGDRRGIARLLGQQALVMLYLREHARAAALCRESLALHREVGDQWAIACYLPVLAGVAFGQGQPELAARLFGAAAALNERLGSSLPPVGRRSYDRTVAVVRATLGEAAFASAWISGETMSSADAITFALSENAGALP
ncbi:MAG: tetratricopeptide repeat protein [Dehalococcoidia bacterium]